MDTNKLPKNLIEDAQQMIALTRDGVLVSPHDFARCVEGLLGVIQSMTLPTGK